VESSNDRFPAFVDWLARNIDDHDKYGAGLAAEFFMSRTLLDRLVKAAAGEPTATLRRRLLLERAAFQLRTGRWPVIDVAVGAGYSSGEAFARAFRRAFGSAPTAWRFSPRGFISGRNSRVHFFPPGGLRLPAQSDRSCPDLRRLPADARSERTCRGRKRARTTRSAGSPLSRTRSALALR
jgi:AraC family transcriptional regulator